MAYMSYCRHEGTLYELKCCLADAEEHVNEEAEYSVSDNEIRCFKDIITDVYDWMCDMALINEYGELDTDELNNICEKMRHSYREDEDNE